MNNGQTFAHAEMDCKTKPNMGQKRVDMDGFRFKPVHTSRQFYNSNFKESKLLAEIQAHFKEWSVWLARANVFGNEVGSRSYATIVKHGKK